MKRWPYILITGAIVVVVVYFARMADQPHTADRGIQKSNEQQDAPSFWKAPDTTLIRLERDSALIRYGRNLIAKTSFYLGPKGTIANISNGMNCQNCHLNAGTVPFGNNFGSVASLYPRYRERSGGIESIEKRVNDCLQRSLNGQPLDSLSREMRAMVAYLNWVGKDVPKGEKANGSGLIKLSYLPRAADTIRGKKVFLATCTSCHQKDGSGLPQPDGGGYFYPPLWGARSFNTAAGLYRISNMARYVFANMPVGSTHHKPILSQEEAWDVAAYLVSRPRPHRDFKKDWPNLDSKPIDHPFGPYADNFSEAQHKYGPFTEIEKSRKTKN